MMSERGLDVVHTTIYRWVQRFGFCCKELIEKIGKQRRPKIVV